MPPPAVQAAASALPAGNGKGYRVEHLLPAHPQLPVPPGPLTCPRISCSSRCQALWSSSNWGGCCPWASPLSEREGLSSRDVGPGVGQTQLGLTELSRLKWGSTSRAGWGWGPCTPGLSGPVGFTPSTLPFQLTHQQERGAAPWRLAEFPGMGPASPLGSESMPRGPRADQSWSTAGAHHQAVKEIRIRM